MARQNKGPWLDLNRYGVYCVRWTEPPTVKGGRSNSREKSCETTDYKEATVKFAEFLLEGEQARLEELRKARAINKPTCAELFDHYRELYLYNPLAKVAAPEQQEYYLALLGEFFGPMKIDEVTAATVQEYCRLRGTPVRLPNGQRNPDHIGKGRATSSGTLRRELVGGFLAALNLCAAASKDTGITIEDVPFFIPPEDSDPRDLWLKEDERETYLRWTRARASERGRLFIMIAMHAAARRGAIESLTWDQVDFTTGLIHFNPQGRRQTNKHRPDVPMNKELFAELAAIPEERRRGLVLGTDASVDRAIEVVNKVCARETAARTDLPAAEREALRLKFLSIGPHVMRHTWATLAARAGRPMYEIAGVLGDSIQTVTRTYIGHCPDHLRNAVEFHTKGEKVGHRFKPLAEGNVRYANFGQRG
jgi:hypothetical protein